VINTIKPHTANGIIAVPPSGLFNKLHIIFSNSHTPTIHTPNLIDLFQNAFAKKYRYNMTQVNQSIFSILNIFDKYCFSISKNSITFPSITSGIGNQNILVNIAKIVNKIPLILFLYAK